MIRKLLLWASTSQRLQATLPRHRFFRRAVRRFMPGEDAEAALSAATSLQQAGIATIFTLLGENIKDASEARQVAQHYKDLLSEIQRRKLDGEVSVKLTQLGLDLDREIAFEKLKSIVEHARQLNRGIVWIDMEPSAYVDITLELFRRTREKYSNVGVCLQAYLYRTEQDLKDLLTFTANIRLVKGAYAEPKNVAFPRKRDVDQNYSKLATLLLQEGVRKDGDRPAIATHDDRLIRQLQDAARKAGIDKSSYEFEMLYGIRRELQRQLVSENYRLRVLISYGSEWFPWYMRRLAERPANLWFVIKNLLTP